MIRYSFSSAVMIENVDSPIDNAPGNNEEWLFSLPAGYVFPFRIADSQLLVWMSEAKLF
jgi:hypothetical protein